MTSQVVPDAERQEEFVRPAFEIESEFQFVRNAWVRDPRIAGLPLSIYLYIRSHHVGFRLSRSKVMQALGIGKSAFSTAIDRLVDAGYMTVERRRYGSGVVAQDGKSLAGLWGPNRYVLLDGGSDIGKNPGQQEDRKSDHDGTGSFSEETSDSESPGKTPGQQEDRKTDHGATRPYAGEAGVGESGDSPRRAARAAREGRKWPENRETPGQQESRKIGSGSSGHLTEDHFREDQSSSSVNEVTNEATPSGRDNDDEKSSPSVGDSEAAVVEVKAADPDTDSSAPGAEATVAGHTDAAPITIEDTTAHALLELGVDAARLVTTLTSQLGYLPAVQLDRVAADILSRGRRANRQISDPTSYVAQSVAREPQSWVVRWPSALLRPTAAISHGATPPKGDPCSDGHDFHDGACVRCGERDRTAAVEPCPPDQHVWGAPLEDSVGPIKAGSLICERCNTVLAPVEVS